MDLRKEIYRNLSGAGLSFSGGPYLVQEIEVDRAFHPEFAGKLWYEFTNLAPDGRKAKPCAVLDAPAYARADAHKRGVMLGQLLVDVTEAFQDLLAKDAA